MESSLLILIPLVILLVSLLFIGAILLTTAFWGAFALGSLRFSLSNPGVLNRIVLGLIGGLLWVFACSTPPVIAFFGGEALLGRQAAGLPNPTITPPAEATDEDIATPPPTAVGTEPAPTPTETAQASPAGTAKVTAGQVQVFSGPGYAYEVLGTAGIETEFELLGRSADSTWLVVRQPLSNTVGWVQAGYVEASIPLTGIFIETDIPPTPEPASTPRITGITFPAVVGTSNTPGAIVFTDLEKDVTLATFETVYGNFVGFTVEVRGPLLAVEFEIYPCGTQKVTLSVTLQDAAGNTSSPAYFSFECRAS